MLNIRVATLDDAVAMSSCLRPADLQELQASSGLPPLDALIVPFRLPGCRTFAVYAPDGILCLYGARHGPLATTWAVCSTRIDKHWRDFVRLSRVGVQLLCAEFGVLHNYADCRNELHLRWLKHLGAQFLSIKPIGVERRPFQEFTLYVCPPCCRSTDGGVSVHDVCQSEEGRR